MLMDGTRVLGVLCSALLVVSSCAGGEEGGARYSQPGDAGKHRDASADRGGNAGTFGAGGTGGGGSGGTGGRSSRDADRDRNVRDADSDADNCGDEIVQGNEECDDGNRLPGDGCDENCRSEPPPPYDTCTGEKV